MMHFPTPKHATSHSSSNILRCFVLFTIFGICAPQGYYYNNYPVRRSGYSYNAATAAQQQRRPQASTAAATAANNRLTNAYNYQSNANPISNYNSNAPQRNDPYSSKRYKDEEQRGKYRVSKADSENAKFAGVSNQEAAAEESGKTFKHKKRKFQNRLRPYLDPCLGLGRDAGNGNTTPAPKEQGRFLWDLNVYNVYPSTPVIQQSPFGGGCGGGGYGGGGGFGGGLGGLASLVGLGGGGLGGGGLGGGLLSDPYPVQQPPLNNFLSLFAPGILQNALAVTQRPQLQQFQSDVDYSEANDLQSDPEVDPAYMTQQVQQQPVRRRPPPNRVYYDSAGASPVTPAQLVGGVATTVNGIIQQLTGNIQPVYQQSYRSQQSYRNQQPYRRSAGYYG